MFIRENSPVWDLNKERIIGPERESFYIVNVEIDAPLPYEWLRLEDDETQEGLGYGWITVNENEGVATKIVPVFVKGLTPYKDYLVKIYLNLKVLQ